MIDLARLKDAPVPPARTEARARALAAANRTFLDASAVSTGVPTGTRSRRSALRRHAPLAASIAAVLMVAPTAFHYLSRHPAPVDKGMADGGGVGQVPVARAPAAAAKTAGVMNSVAVPPAASAPPDKIKTGAPAAAPPPALAADGAGASARSAAPQTKAADCPPGRACLTVQPGLLPEPARQAAPAEARVGLAADGPTPIQRAGNGSTARLNTDTMPFALVRQAINAGRLPPKDDVQVGALINAYAFAYPASNEADIPLRPSVTVVPSPWNSTTQLVHVGLAGQVQAQDARIEVDFDRAMVSTYRLIGQETPVPPRTSASAATVTVHAIQSGRSVTTIYEIAPVIEHKRMANLPDANERTRRQLGFLTLRYTLPNEDRSRLISTPIVAVPQPLKSAPADVRFSIAVAAFGQLLKGSAHIGSFGYDDVIALAEQAKGDDPFGDRAQFIDLVRQAKTARP